MVDKSRLVANGSGASRLAKRSAAHTWKVVAMIVFMIIVGRAAHAQDAFAGVRCNADIPKTIVGKVLENERVVVTESKHRDIQLKNTGGTEISNTLFLSGWAMCGKDYQLLQDNGDVIRDALPFVHSISNPAFLGTCEIAGRKMSEEILAVLNIPVPAAAGRHYAPNDTTLVPAISAWRIDKTRAQFVKISVGQLRCPRSGIWTEDGGP
jgi:hypothetical protein